MATLGWIVRTGGVSGDQRLWDVCVPSPRDAEAIAREKAGSNEARALESFDHDRVETLGLVLGEISEFRDRRGE